MDDDDRDDSRGGFLRLERGRRQPPTRTSSTSSPTTKAGRMSAITAPIKTTNIDTLAQGGARREQFYAQPMCALTVAAVITGRYPFPYGLRVAIPSAHLYRLPTDEWLLPRALKQASYETVLIGKWHMGHADRKN